MPAQVIVVTRPRRSLFAVPRALPDWLRSLWAALFRKATQAGGLASLDPPGLRSVDLPLFPELVVDDHGSHRCIGCELCALVCPTRCLSIATENGGIEARRVTRFSLASGACIGCGYCAEACPERAILMTPTDDRVALAPLDGGSGVVDLLPDPSRMQG